MVRRHNAVVRTLASLIHAITGAAVHVERRTEELRRLFQGRMQEGQMDLIITNFAGVVTYIDVCIVSPILANQHHLVQAAKKTGMQPCAQSTANANATQSTP